MNSMNRTGKLLPIAAGGVWGAASGADWAARFGVLPPVLGLVVAPFMGIDGLPPELEWVRLVFSCSRILADAAVTAQAARSAWAALASKWQRLKDRLTP